MRFISKIVQKIIFCGPLVGWVLLLAACNQADGFSPQVSLSQPANGSTTSSPTLTVSGSASDDAGVTKLTYQLGSGPEQ
ncbi:Ig-like domain-containing protein, partial [Calidithermus roseus]|uniref:Ig-like domain-containing protein n=1 Tax=Calidithermus roseus TaxID=1644118 RepID=UPI0015F88DCF